MARINRILLHALLGILFLTVASSCRVHFHGHPGHRPKTKVVHHHHKAPKPKTKVVHRHHKAPKQKTKVVHHPDFGHSTTIEYDLRGDAIDPDTRPDTVPPNTNYGSVTVPPGYAPRDAVESKDKKSKTKKYKKSKYKKSKTKKGKTKSWDKYEDD